jgi:hypothetical protein
MAEEAKKTVGKLEFTERKVVHSGEAPRYYANNTEIGMTSFDISIKFAQIVGADEGELIVNDQAIVSMSLHHAKALARILVAYVKQFEQQHGPLFVPTPEDIGEIPHEGVKTKVNPNS